MSSAHFYCRKNEFYKTDDLYSEDKILWMNKDKSLKYNIINHTKQDTATQYNGLTEYFKEINIFNIIIKYIFIKWLLFQML